jgi:hypothetical protein
MTTPGSGSSRPAASPDGGLHQTPASHSPTETLAGNWPAQAADKIVDVVDRVREKSTGPIQTAARGLVYGIVAGILGTMVAVLVIVGAIRLLDAVQPWGNVWLPYLELGLTFLVAGSLIFRRRRLGED